MAQPRVIVIGGGVMGLATGDALARHGARVTVLERFTVGHEWASSHGLTRIIRHEYGAAAIYSAMVARSLTLWNELARETGRQLYDQTGILTLGQPDDGQTLPGFAVMRDLGLPVEQLTPDECARRFPQFTPGDYAAITYNPIGGMLYAGECLRALADRLQRSGGELREGAHVILVTPQSDHVTIHLADGSALTADYAIVTAGPWVHDVLPELRLPVRATRQQVCYLGGLDVGHFGVGHFPVFLAGMLYYGLPLQGPGWLKVACHRFGATVNPNVPYTPDEDEIASVRAFLRQTIPAAANAELAQMDMCMYDVTPDEDFILDHHPASRRIVIGSGFSGHGLKFGVVIGEMLAALALDQPSHFPLERFRLARFAA